MKPDYEEIVTHDASDFVVLSDYVPGIVQEIRYHSTYNFIGDRMFLREAMLRNGFAPLDTEWWHFALANEPYPYTYFNFPVAASSVHK